MKLVPAMIEQVTATPIDTPNWRALAASARDTGLADWSPAAGY
jgi:hypothetical protein